MSSEAMLWCLYFSHLLCLSFLLSLLLSYNVEKKKMGVVTRNSSFTMHLPSPTTTLVANNSNSEIHKIKALPIKTIQITHTIFCIVSTTHSGKAKCGHIPVFPTKLWVSCNELSDQYPRIQVVTFIQDSMGGAWVEWLYNFPLNIGSSCTCPPCNAQ